MYPESINTANNYYKNGKIYYNVQKDDELWAIATANGTSTAKLAKLNRLEPTAVIKAGRKLIIAIQE